MEKVTLWMPPLYMLYLSGVFQFFPADIFTARMASSFVAFLSALALIKFLDLWNVSKKGKISALILFVSDFLFIKTTHSSRMESLCLFFALLGFISIRKLYVEKSKSFSKIFLAGFFLSLSFLSHPFGAVYGFISLYLLFLQKSIQVKNLIYFFFGLLIPTLVWGLYIFPNFEIFTIQFGAQFSRKSELFTTFSQLTKLKIILSSFRFPIPRILLTCLLLAGIFFYRKKIKNQTGDLLHFSVFWLISISGFLYLSSESWYVAYLICPLTILTILIYETKTKFSKLIFFSSIGLNVFILSWIFIQNYFFLKTPQKTEEFFSLIGKELQTKKRIYIQSIPDPYFYLKKNYPDKILLEFMPGELSIPHVNFQETIQKQDAFLFYNEDLINQYIKNYLEENSNQFERKIIKVETENPKELKLETFIYLKK